MLRSLLLLLLAVAVPATTSTEWRDDGKNVIVVRELNRAYRSLPFSEEYDEVSDRSPVELDWSTGPNLPLAWKGGVAGSIGGDIVLAGGLWMPGRANRAYAFSPGAPAYREIPPPPYETAYTQGACDGRSLFLVGGRSAGRRVARLDQTAQGAWKWTDLPPLPEAEGAGRWVAASATVAGKWLFLVGGHPTGTQFETRSRPALADYRLRLDRPGAAWETMAPFPGGARGLIAAAVARGRLYLFGGSTPDPEMRSVYTMLVRDFGLLIAPYKGVHDYRDAYRYDPDTDRWQRLRNLPLGRAGGSALAWQDRYILLLGSGHTFSYRAGKTDRAGIVAMETHAAVSAAAGGGFEPFWTGYNDLVLCYDVETDRYARVGVMLYGVATSAWAGDGAHLYGFGGEPHHRFNENTENVLQVATVRELH